MTESAKRYPIAECFVSPQGEGVYTGVAMAFIRFAGCTVGKPFPKDNYVSKDYLQSISDKIKGKLPLYTEQCTLYDGRHFACDTDYRVHERLTIQEIMDTIPSNVEHVCITGGEPLMHDLSTVFTYLLGANKKIHIETSGTIVKFIPRDIWVTVSPKFNVYMDMIGRADEIKILVDDDIELSKSILTLTSGIPQAIYLTELAKVKPVYLQPVNGELEVNEHNLKLCMNYQEMYPQFRVSVQMHKVLSAITKELVR